MKNKFAALMGKLIAPLSDAGYKLDSQQQTDKVLEAVFTSEASTVKLDYDFAAKSFNLYRGPVGGDLRKASTYLFDLEAGDGDRELDSIANDFADTIAVVKPTTRAASLASRGKQKDPDETSAVFFVNRIPTVMPECREPLRLHKEHYETVLPNSFCGEVVVAALRDMLDEGKNAQKITKFFDLLNKMYEEGDLDTKGIIVQTILNSVTNPLHIELVNQKLSENLRKAWAAGRKYIGKEVKPEKVSKLTQMAKNYSTQLNQ